MKFPEGRFYSKRISNAFSEFVEAQTEDLADAVDEIARLSETYLDSARTNASDEKMLADCLELWSAYVYYGSAFASNLSMLVPAIGQEIKLEIPPDEVEETIYADTNAISATGLWRVGTPKEPGIPAATRVRFTQNPQRPDEWTVAIRQVGLESGVYCLEYEFYSQSAGGTREASLHTYLDYHPAPQGLRTGR